jgi:glycosyltransferase involved in cell wall biosynthesis
MEEAALVVLPYREIESSGVLATALGHGRPVVVTDVGSLGDTVREFAAGAVVPPGDAETLAEACSQLLREPMRTTTAARQVLSWERSAEAHERLYEQVLAERRIR